MRGVAVDVRNDLDEEIRLVERAQDRVEVEHLVLVAHRRDGAEHGAIIQPADQNFLVVGQRRLRQFLREAPDFAPARDRRLVVEIHRMDVTALFAMKADRDHLTGLGIVAKAGRIRHADEFIFDDRLG